MILKAKEMQAAEEENQAKSRSDEESINFRPSPNFKHMKKYLKVHKEEGNSSSGEANSSRFEDNSSRGEANSSRRESNSSRGETNSSRFEDNSSRGEANSSRRESNSSRGETNSSRGEAKSSSGEANTSLLGHKKLEKVNKTAMVATAAVQPPLPPNPPPPDTPPMIVNVKQEIVDDEYNCSTTETSSGLEQSNELRAAAAPIKTDHSEEKAKQGLTMCRNFARGTCKKGTACIFAHELILSQLPGVYTFCRNFQNSVCSFPKCKFVHATVFEKEHFFRTGYLPPHALAHLQEASVVQPPPPPPQPEEAPVVLPPIYSSAAAAPAIPCVPPVVQYNAVAGPELMHSAVADPNIFNTLQSVTSTSPKREWREIDEASSSTRLLDSGEPLAKKCKNCDNNELREQLMKAKVEKAARSNKELIQKIEAAYKKSSLISELIGVIFETKELPTAAEGLRLHPPTTEPDVKRDMLLGGSSHNNLTSALAMLLRTAKSVLTPDDL